MIDLSDDLLRALESSGVRDHLGRLIESAIANALERLGLLDELVDAGEAARLLHMTEAAVRKAAYRGALPCQRVGRRLRFRRRDLLHPAKGSTR